MIFPVVRLTLRLTLRFSNLFTQFFHEETGAIQSMLANERPKTTTHLHSAIISSVFLLFVYLHHMRERIHQLKCSVQLFRSQVTDADTLADISDQWHAHLAISVFDSIETRLPCQLGLEVGGMGWEGQRLHALKDTFDSLHRNVATKMTQDTAEKSINVDGLSVHNVSTWNHLQQFREGVS